jgi:hypothetical protein
MQEIINMSKGSQRAILNFTLAPRGEIFPLGRMFTPTGDHCGVNTLLFRRMEG